MTWIQTRNGKKLDLLNPSPDAIDIEEIAIVLARTPRFGGHCTFPIHSPYNNAQHSVLVHDIVKERWPERSELLRPALLHDAHEVYSGFGDVLRPAKYLFDSIRAGIRYVEYQINIAIAERFGFNPKLFDANEIKLADDIALATEARDVMSDHPEPWCELPKPIERRLQPIWIEVAYVQFIRALEHAPENGGPVR